MFAYVGVLVDGKDSVLGADSTFHVERWILNVFSSDMIVTAGGSVNYSFCKSNCLLFFRCRKYPNT